MNRRWRGLAIGTMAILASLPAAAGSSSTGPAAPQQPGQCDPYGDGTCAAPANMVVVNQATAGANDRWVSIGPGASLFVDPHAGNYTTVGPARLATITAAAPGSIKLVIATPAQWLQEIAAANASTLPYVTMQIACRPKTVTLCSAASGGTQSAPIQGSGTDAAGTSGYGVIGSTGTATATCVNPPYGDYTETLQYTCGVVGSGATADGDWGTAISDTDACGGISDTVNEAGNCSASCGGGSEYQTNYNGCGQVVTKGYFGPACNTQSCCSNNWQKSCSGSTAIWTDYGTCHDPSYQVAGGCTYQSYSCSASCVPSYGDSLPPDANGCVYTYTDCWASGNWAPPPGGTNCVPTHSDCTNYTVTGCKNPSQDGGGKNCGNVDAVSCTCGGWQ